MKPKKRELLGFLRDSEPELLKWLAGQCISELMSRAAEPAARQACTDVLKAVKDVVNYFDIIHPPLLKLGPGESFKDQNVEERLTLNRPLTEVALSTYIAWTLLTKFLVACDKDGPPAGFRKAGNLLRRRLPWCKDNAREWAKMLKPGFIAMFGANFEDVPEFQRYIYRPRDVTAGKRRDAIWKCIVQSFVQLAPDEPTIRPKEVSRTNRARKM